MNEVMINNTLSKEAELLFVQYKEAQKEFKEKEEALTNKLKDEMKEKGILSYKNDNLSISYTPESTKETFDTKAFKEKYPDVYKLFVKTSPVKASVRITVKKGITSKNLIENPKHEVTMVPEIIGDVEF